MTIQLKTLRSAFAGEVADAKRRNLFVRIIGDLLEELGDEPEAWLPIGVEGLSSALMCLAFHDPNSAAAIAARDCSQVHVIRRYATDSFACTGVWISVPGFDGVADEWTYSEFFNVARWLECYRLGTQSAASDGGC